jgi:two-component system CheB/CheR fusion protein
VITTTDVLTNLALAPRLPRVLIVDDYDDARDSLCILLQHLGYACATAPNAAAALKAAPAFLPDVVIMDLALPGTDGYETARLLRGLPGLSGVRIVALTGYGRDIDAQRSRKAGFAAHLVKPADPVALQKLLERLGATPDAVAV